MSFEDDEYWESEYDDNPKRPYADTTATARDPYADAVAARWGADTRRPPPRARYVEEDEFDEAPKPAPIAPATFDPGVDELAERRRQRRQDGYQRSPNRDKRIKSAFDSERPGWLDDPAFAPADLAASPVSPPGTEGWQRRSLDFDELEYDDRDFDERDWEEQQRYTASRRSRIIDSRDEAPAGGQVRRDRREIAQPVSGRARVSPPVPPEDEILPGVYESRRKQEFDPLVDDLREEDLLPYERQVAPGRRPARTGWDEGAAAVPDEGSRIARAEPWSEQPAAEAPRPAAEAEDGDTPENGEGPRVLSKTKPPVAPRVLSKAKPPATPRVIKKAEPPATPRVVKAAPSTAAPRVVTPALPNVPKTPAASAPAEVARPTSAPAAPGVPAARADAGEPGGLRPGPGRVRPSRLRPGAAGQPRCRAQAAGRFRLLLGGVRRGTGQPGRVRPGTSGIAHRRGAGSGQPGRLRRGAGFRASPVRNGAAAARPPGPGCATGRSRQAAQPAAGHAGCRTAAGPAVRARADPAARDRRVAAEPGRAAGPGGLHPLGRR